MNSELAIKVENVSKKYCKALKRSMAYGISDILRNTIGLSSHSGQLRDGEFWALQNISFEVKKGEILGIIGPNGSGKTTLLKLLNGIFWPDKGRISISGRTGALIAVGAGFHPLLTGRENIYLNGAVLGMSRTEISKKFAEIIDFADIGDFLDTPIKFYSSGMYVRLGFSVAIHCETDILLIDEVLSVGDMAFQKKCSQKIKTIATNGTTIILVSHNLNIVREICKTAILLLRGQIQCDNSVTHVIDNYYHLQTKLSPFPNDTTNIRGNGIEEGITTKAAIITSVQMVDKNGTIIRSLNSPQTVSFKVNIEIKNDLDNPIFGFMLRNEEGVAICDYNTMYKGINTGFHKAGSKISVEYIQTIGLNRGVYYLSTGIAQHDLKAFIDWQENALIFVVHDDGSSRGILNMGTETIIKNTE